MSPCSLCAAGAPRPRRTDTRRSRVQMPALRIAQDPDADALLARDPLALLIGMLLDQQFPMERAFASPYHLATRLGVERLDADELAGADPDAFAKTMAGPPALHRYPAAMA